MRLKGGETTAVDVEEIHGQIRMAKEAFGHPSHRELYDIAIGMTAQEKAETILLKFRKESQPTRYRGAGERCDGNSLVRHACRTSYGQHTAVTAGAVNDPLVEERGKNDK